MATYVFDSGPFIDLHNYPESVFPTLRAAIVSRLTGGLIVSCEEVYGELTVKDDDVLELVKPHKALFARPSEAEQRIVIEITMAHPELVARSIRRADKFNADPFVIARAEAEGAIVVTSERYKLNAHNVPGICRRRGVEAINLLGFLERERLRFG